MAISYSEDALDNQLDEITALVDAGSGPGLLRVYDGTRPADPDTASVVVGGTVAVSSFVITGGNS